MVEQFLNHINAHNLCKPTDKILLAVSGGLDSVVMLHLFRQAGYEVAVAHCNFQLRGAASAADELFVGERCTRYAVPFHTVRFETLGYSKEKGISIQMAARNLRYQFFADLCKQYGYYLVATAHHLNDSLETVLLNLAKGTGLDGLAGIPNRKDNVIRPMLFASRGMLEEYARLEQLEWREDESNTADDYQRNFLRHHVVPRLKEINPALEKTFASSIERIRAGVGFYRTFVEEFRNRAVTKDGARVLIDKGALMKNESPATLLWELIKAMGFNFDQCRQIVGKHQPGSQFFSAAAGKLYIDRTHFIITSADTAGSPIIIGEAGVTINNGSDLLQSELLEKERFQLEKNDAIAQLDYDKVRFPLLWRSWQAGDTFMPLGMRKHKKVSDFLIDLKVPLPDKERVTVIESEGTIVWVVGLRIHEQFKVSDGTLRVLRMRLLQE